MELIKTTLSILGSASGYIKPSKVSPVRGYLIKSEYLHYTLRDHAAALA